MSSSVERREFQIDQLSKLGLEFDLVKAISVSEIEEAVFDKLIYTWERPMRKTEVACFLSHRYVWQKIVDINEPVLVLEDDALLSSKTPEVLHALKSRGEIDHVSLETRGRKKILGKSKQNIAGVSMRSLYLDKSGAAAYILWPNAAKSLVDRTEGRAALADAELCAAHYLRKFQIEPALAVQVDQCESIGLISPIDSQSTIGVMGRPSVDKTKAGTLMVIKCRVRRILGQFKIAARHCYLLLGAQRRIINFDQSQNKY